ncbi:MAG: carboxypeptidase-like regulatory domain-containing protein, partial [Pseudomonadota bacterium]
RHYLESIELRPPQTLGRLTGRALLETVSPTAGVMLQIMDASWEPPAYSDVDGQFVFTDLSPGDYSVLASLLGWETTSSTGWTVTAGGETDVGDIVLDVIVDPLFADGFESP